MTNTVFIQDILKKTHIQAMIIAGSLISGCVLMIGIFVLVSVGRGSNMPDSSSLVLLRSVAWLVGAAGIVGSMFLKKTVLTVSGEIGLQEVINRLNNSVLIPFALCEGPVLFGAVAYFLSKNPSDLAMPIVVGCLGFSMHFPQYAQWENWVRNHRIVN